MTMESFFDEYAHLYLIKQEENEAQYLLYESPPTYAYNWQWEADPDDFYEETKNLQWCESGRFIKIMSPPKITTTIKEIYVQINSRCTSSWAAQQNVPL